MFFVGATPAVARMKGHRAGLVSERATSGDVAVPDLWDFLELRKYIDTRFIIISSSREKRKNTCLDNTEKNSLF